MKKLGLIGGMGPESTIPYYHDIVYGVQEAIGEQAFPELAQMMHDQHLMPLEAAISLIDPEDDPE